MVALVGKKNPLTREQWLKKKLADIPAGSRILDSGAGELKYAKYCSHLNYVSQDFGKYDGSGDGIGLQRGSWDNSKLDIVSDITSIPEPDQSFDAIMCIEVLEHIPNPVVAIKELSRLLKRGGGLNYNCPLLQFNSFCAISLLYWLQPILL